MACGSLRKAITRGIVLQYAAAPVLMEIARLIHWLGSWFAHSMARRRCPNHMGSRHSHLVILKTREGGDEPDEPSGDAAPRRRLRIVLILFCFQICVLCNSMSGKNAGCIKVLSPTWGGTSDLQGSG